MVINLIDVIEYVDKDISAHYSTDINDDIMIIIPILYHAKIDDDIAILSSKETNIVKDSISFSNTVNGRHYTVYEDWYDYEGDKNDFEQIHEYMSRFNRIMYHLELSHFAIYYRFNNGFPREDGL